MNITRNIYLFSFILLTSVYSYSQVSDVYKKSDLSNKIVSQNSAGNSENLKLNNSVSSKPGEKSPYLGALFSGIIPGTGEFYAKSYLKGGIFLAVEAGLWILYGSYQSKGNSETNNFEQFADQNWDVYKYAGWLKKQNFSGADGIDLSANKDVLRSQINVCEAQNFSHQLPPYGEQQYYELIGKYQNFVVGWADADLSVVNRNNYGTYRTDMYESYSYNRQGANSWYDKGTTTLTVILLNHILSAGDAAWSVSMFNKNLKIKTGIQMENTYSYYGQKKLTPVANINVEF